MHLVAVALATLFALALWADRAAAAVPTVGDTSASAVTYGSALLEAKIDPEGEATTYHFEYGLSDCSSSICADVPTPDGTVGSGSAPVSIADEVTGLQPGTTYHFRVVAINPSGETLGLDKTFITYAKAPPSSCPNEAFRQGASAALPDCRAYEMVTPIEKNGGDIFVSLTGRVRHSNNVSSIAGGRFSYSAGASFGDQPSGRGSNQYMATRTTSGWTSHGINAPLGNSLGEPVIQFLGDIYPQFKLFSPDLSQAWMSDTNKTPLTSDASLGWPNLYRRDNLDDSYEALTTTIPTGATQENEGYFPEVQGHSADFSHIVFAVAGGLTPDAAPGSEWQLYDSHEGQLHLVSVLPDGTAATGSASAGTVENPGGVADEYNGMVDNAVAEDGSRIFWSESPFKDGGQGPLYVRENPTAPQSALGPGEECTEPAKACTVQISSDPTAQFWTAAADGSRAIFSTGELGNATLSEFDVESETSSPIAGEAGGVVGASDNTAYLYFTSKEALAAGATAGELNLYLDHEGTKTFIATLSPQDSSGRGAIENFVTSAGGIDLPHALQHAARVTPDGQHLAFMSNRSLTGYDNTDVLNGKADEEVFLYDAGSEELVCASCNPSGVRPVGSELQQPYSLSFAGSPDRLPTKLWGAAWIQTWVQNVYASRALTDDGNRLFLNSFDALVPEDTNGLQDVYQWEADGSGSCAKPGGCISLISTGKSGQISEFVDATADGSEVFFETTSSINPEDPPGSVDIYTARVNGGFPEPQPTASCEGEACQGPVAAPNDPTLASAAYNGPGNVKPAKKHPRCKPKHRKGKRSAAARKQGKRCKGTKRKAQR